MIKSVYFDKPKSSNWFVNWHQDLTVNLKKRIHDIRFKNWRELKDRVVVQPNIELLESILIFRIHLDSAGKNNGALSIIEESERDRIIRISENYLEYKHQKIRLIEVSKGEIMIMSPLTVHSSKRSIKNESRRRVIHIEVTNKSCVVHLPLMEMYEF